jgi:hypothetical protein
MPEPAAKPTRWMARCFFTTKRPSGGMTLNVSPALIDCAAQLEKTPPSTGRMPISSSPALLSRLRGLLIE